jgi:heme/copper-type cytochrome/quinol oxidase subunit 3
VGTRSQEQAHDRRTIEIAYVVVSSVVLFAVLAAAYKVLLARVDQAWQVGLSTVGLPGAVLVIVLLVLRGVRLLRRLELHLHS